MELFLGIFIALSYIAAVIFTRQVTTFFHEMGHAIPAMFFNQTDKPVQVFIGSYGDIEGCYTLNFSGLQLFIKPNLLDWKLGMCRHHGSDKAWKDILIIACGPIASTIISGFLLLVIIKFNPSDLGITIAGIFMTSALIDLLVNLNPSSKPIYFFDGSVGYCDGYQLVLHAIRAFLPNDIKDLLEKFEQEDYKAVIHLGQKMIAKNAKRKEVLYAILNAHIQLRQYEEAVEVYHEINKYIKIDADDHFVLCELMLKLNDLDEALNHINVFIHKNHENAYALNYRGYIFIKKEEWQEAKFDLTNAQRINPYHPLVNSNLGLLYLKQRDFSTAEKYLNLALKITQEDGLVWYNKGLWFEEKWDWKGALDCYENAKKYGYEYHGLEMKIAEMEGLVIND